MVLLPNYMEELDGRAERLIEWQADDQDDDDDDQDDVVVVEEGEDDRDFIGPENRRIDSSSPALINTFF